MAQSANRHHIQVTLWRIAVVVMVFVPAFTGNPHMSAVVTRKSVWMRSASGSDFNVYALPGLRLVTVSRQMRQRAKSPRS